MKALGIIGKLLFKRIKAVSEMAIVFLLSLVGVAICALPGVAIAALFWGTTTEILFTGGLLFLSFCGLVIWVVKAITKFCRDFKTEASKNDN